ncbi:MAG: phosphate ABC transporter ATP-binding protein PstB [Elusimicrobiota bacterium]|nr:phosphate ABC transporter ATP-binding protein PstB [Endomicrobiia bacterium]MDW8166096.1 phosphate ABC transporter ATP-binding protein PstB [Elusimicrobiota bacterium]
MSEEIKIDIQNLSAWYGSHQVLKDINLPVYKNKVTAIIGPSGCGKSTLIRCINRLHEIIPNSKVEGKILLDGKNIYDIDVDPMEVRKKVGMVFQQPNPFPTMTIFENIAIGLKLNGIKNKSVIEETVINALIEAGLYEEVKHKLFSYGTHLSGGQQQRLCIARTLALKPEVILFDEPCSALDPISTAKIEELIVELKKNHTIIIVTHNLQQAARVSDYTVFLYLGELIEYGLTQSIFAAPKMKKTEEYIRGRFG